MDTKTSLEMLNMQTVPELASLDDKAFEFMRNKARLDFIYGEDQKVTEAEIRENKRKEEI